jgi:hypothetical protein
MRGRTPYGKGGARRPRFVTRQLWELNYELATGKIDQAAYDKEKKLCQK